MLCFYFHGYSLTVERNPEKLGKQWHIMQIMSARAVTVQDTSKSFVISQHVQSFFIFIIALLWQALNLTFRNS